MTPSADTGLETQPDPRTTFAHRLRTTLHAGTLMGHSVCLGYKIESNVGCPQTHSPRENINGFIVPVMREDGPQWRSPQEVLTAFGSVT